MKKHILIIGGTRGVGRAFTKSIICDGNIVSVIGRRPPLDIDKDLSGVNYWQVDLAEHKKLLKILSKIISRNGKLDSLVFFQRYRGDGDEWQSEIATSLTATKNIIEYLFDKFGSKSEKSIVIVSSLASIYIAQEQQVSYHVAKAGLNHMARFYAVSLGSIGIRVNCVSFGAVLKDESRDFYLKNKKLYNLYKNITPLGRMVDSKNVADVISFLCSEKSSCITGQNIIVDGGISIQSHETLARRLTPLKKMNILRKKMRVK
ncbi:MAG: SDR family oxidoreductase [Candidatus Omnitrophota bacterium]